MICLHINADDRDNERILDFFGISKSELPALRAVVLGKDLSKFMPDDKNITAAALKEFVGKFVDGKLKVCIKILTHSQVFLFCSLNKKLLTILLLHFSASPTVTLCLNKWQKFDSLKFHLLRVLAYSWHGLFSPMLVYALDYSPISIMVI